jgi:hypothetical protein
LPGGFSAPTEVHIPGSIKNGRSKIIIYTVILRDFIV